MGFAVMNLYSNVRRVGRKAHADARGLLCELIDARARLLGNCLGQTAVNFVLLAVEIVKLEGSVSCVMEFDVLGVGENRFDDQIFIYFNISFFFDVVVVTATIFIFNYLLTLFYSWLLKTSALLHFHVNLHISTMATTNVILMPMMLILFFYPYKFLCVIIIAILLILFSIRFVKLLIEVRMLSKLNFVNIFLYLCTVEILPILIIFKMVLMAV